MDGQITITEYFKSLVECGAVKDLTSWINSQGKAQYNQIKDIISEYIKDDELLDRLTNAVSVYVLNQSLGYSEYLRRQMKH